MGVGKNIEELAKKKGMSLRQIAIKADIPYSTLYSAVKRDSSGIDPLTLQKIAQALDVTPLWLIYGEGASIQTAIDSEAKEVIDDMLDNMIGDFFAERKIALFNAAAALIGYEVVYKEDGVKLVSNGVDSTVYDAGEVIAEHIPFSEFAKAVNTSMQTVSALCFQMSDAYKKYEKEFDASKEILQKAQQPAPAAPQQPPAATPDKAPKQE